jgi:ferredoxin
MAIIKVWIEEGCTVCNECESSAPEVFHVTDETSVIKGEAREDGVTDENEATKSPLKGDLGSEFEEEIKEAAEGCPVDIIKFEEA